MYPWFKYIFHKFLEIPYYWFFANNLSFFFRLVFNDIKLYVLSLLDFSFNLNLNQFFIKSFFYFDNSVSNSFNIYDYKNFLKKQIIQII